MAIKPKLKFEFRRCRTVYKAAACPTVQYGMGSFPPYDRHIQCYGSARAELIDGFSSASAYRYDVESVVALLVNYRRYLDPSKSMESTMDL